MTTAEPGSRGCSHPWKEHPRHGWGPSVLSTLTSLPAQHVSASALSALLTVWLTCLRIFGSVFGQKCEKH